MKKIIATVLTALLLLSVVACENVSDESYVQTEHPTAESSITAAAEETVQATPSGADEPSLSLLSCRADEDGTYCIDQTTWKSSAFPNIPNRSVLLLTTLRNRLS